MATNMPGMDAADISALARAIASQIRNEGTGLLANVPTTEINSNAKQAEADYQFSMLNLEKHLGRGFIDFVK